MPASEFVEWCFHFGWIELPPTEEQILKKIANSQGIWGAILTATTRKEGRSG